MKLFWQLLSNKIKDAFFTIWKLRQVIWNLQILTKKIDFHDILSQKNSQKNCKIFPHLRFSHWSQDNEPMWKKNHFSGFRNFMLVERPKNSLFFGFLQHFSLENRWKNTAEGLQWTIMSTRPLTVNSEWFKPNKNFAILQVVITEEHEFFDFCKIFAKFFDVMRHHEKLILH